MPNTRPRHLICGCCGSSAWGRQYWNHDKGYGLCKSCAHWFDKRIAEFRAAGRLDRAEELEADLRGYGARGHHFDVPEPDPWEAAVTPSEPQ